MLYVRFIYVLLLIINVHIVNNTSEQRAFVRLLCSITIRGVDEYLTTLLRLPSNLDDSITFLLTIAYLPTPYET